MGYGSFKDKGLDEFLPFEGVIRYFGQRAEEAHLLQGRGRPLPSLVFAEDISKIGIIRLAPSDEGKRHGG